jgi:hypothetical protein
MIDPTKAELALEWLTNNADTHAELVGALRSAEDYIKKIEALLVKGMDNQGVPITVRKDYARADERYQKALDDATAAKIALVKNEDLMDAAKIRISLYQTQVKDRL